MAINQLSTANTFQQWLIATQSLIEKSNFFEDTANLIFETANNTSNTANLVFAEAAVVNAQTALVLTTADNVDAVYGNTLIALNTANSIIQSANSFANTVNVTAQAAFDTANAALAVSTNAANLIYEVLDDTSNDTTLFVALFDANTGTPNTAYVSSTKLYYNPSTGQLSALNFDSLSDINKKTEIETIKNAIDLVTLLRGVTFKWKDNGIKSMGLIAQEIETVIPEVVVTNVSGDKSVTYGSLVGLLIEAIKQLNDDIVKIKDIINK
jgi:hypothetical protein